MKNTVASEMTERLVTVPKDQPLEKAYEIMMQLSVRHLPVTDENGEICAIISDRDVQRGATSDIQIKNGVQVEILSFKPELRVSDYMTYPPKFVSAESTLESVAQTMIQNKISALLVVEDSDIVGIVTSEDMLNALVHLTHKEGHSREKLDPYYTRNFIGRLAQMVSDVGI